MKTYTIESRVTRIETICIKAKNRKEALNKAEEIRGIFWETIKDEERQLISIS